MKGFLYRFGVALKEAGELIRWRALIRLGLAIREQALGQVPRSW
jgi:hypothetical protein